MRNTPLWQPQPEQDIADDEAGAPVGRKRIAARAAIGSAIALGVCATAAVAFMAVKDGAAPVVGESVVADAQPAAPEVETGLPEVARRPPVLSDAGFSQKPDPAAQPAHFVADDKGVQVAENEADVAWLEEMTGMVQPSGSPDEGGQPSAVGGPLVDLRAGMDSDPLAPGPLTPDPSASGPTMAVDRAPVEPDAMAQTASIEPPAPVAEASRPDPTPEQPEASAQEKPDAAAQAPLPALSATRVNQHVNLRAGPADGSRVITVVPAGATVQAQANCRWCVATYNGQRGYIFNSFLRGKAPTASAEPAVKAPSSKPGLY